MAEPGRARAEGSAAWTAVVTVKEPNAAALQTDTPDPDRSERGGYSQGDNSDPGRRFKSDPAIRDNPPSSDRLSSPAVTNAPGT
jgi:hypothetical protein